MTSETRTHDMVVEPGGSVHAVLPRAGEHPPAWAKFTRSSSKDGGRGYEVGCTSESTEAIVRAVMQRAEIMANLAEQALDGSRYHHDPNGCERDCPCVLKALEARRVL